MWIIKQGHYLKFQMEVLGLMDIFFMASQISKAKEEGGDLYGDN